MQTNNFYACQAQEHSNRLVIFSANGEKAAVIYPEGADTFQLLRPVELRWLAYAIESFVLLHGKAAAAGLTQRHDLSILPDEPE